jgi:hypothetical protein
MIIFFRYIITTQPNHNSEMMELNLLSNGQRAFRGYDHIFLGRGGIAPSAGGRSRKVHGGQRLGAAGGRSRKVHGGNRMYVRAGGSRRKVGGRQRLDIV